MLCGKLHALGLRDNPLWQIRLVCTQDHEWNIASLLHLRQLTALPACLIKPSVEVRKAATTRDVENEHHSICVLVKFQADLFELIPTGSVEEIDLQVKPRNLDWLHAIIDADGGNILLHKPSLAIPLDEAALSACCGAQGNYLDPQAPSHRPCSCARLTRSSWGFGSLSRRRWFFASTVRSSSRCAIAAVGGVVPFVLATLQPFQEVCLLEAVIVFDA
mmetsp:Transcript_20631/g.45197  ORF Transcript_20631/g.45197 Transcript_20631/m.45197 type:complete len:218 (+) Transcript_20631:230-883(+)